MGYDIITSRKLLYFLCDYTAFEGVVSLWDVRVEAAEAAVLEEAEAAASAGAPGASAAAGREARSEASGVLPGAAPAAASEVSAWAL